MSKHSNFFDEQGHLNDAGVMLWADAMRLQREDELPEALKEHLELCSECRMSVFDYYEFKKDDDIAELANHFYFDKKRVEQATTTTVKPIAASTKKRIGLLPKRMVVAASVVLLLATGVWVVQNIDKNPAVNTELARDNTSTQPSNTTTQKNAQTKPAPKTTTEKQTNTDQKATNEKPPKAIEVAKNPPAPVFDDAIAFLDQKIQRTNRNRGNERVNSPQQGATFAIGQAIGFKWASQAADAFELRVFTKNTQGTPQIIKINGATSQYQFAQKLKSGKHYWRLFKVNQGRKKEIGLGSFQIK